MASGPPREGSDEALARSAPADEPGTRASVRRLAAAVRQAVDQLALLREENRTLKRKLKARTGDSAGSAADWSVERQEVRLRVERLGRDLERLLDSETPLQ